MARGSKLSALSDVQDQMRECARVQIVGSGTRKHFALTSDSPAVSTRGLCGIVQHDVEDQVVEVWAGTTLEQLQQELARHGLCLPLANDLESTVSQNYGTVGGFLSTNLPHAYSSQYGGPRDWTLGMTVVRTDGTLAKCGSKAVKSVAGYDAHRLFVGSRGCLVLIASVFLRTFPIKAMTPHAVVTHAVEAPRFIARTLRSEFEETVERTKGLTAVDPASCTLWSTFEPFTHGSGWMMGFEGARVAPVQPFEARAKQVFDPQSKLAPGWKA